MKYYVSSTLSVINQFEINVHQLQMHLEEEFNWKLWWKWNDNFELNLQTGLSEESANRCSESVAKDFLMDVRCNLLLSLLLRTSQNPTQCARRDYLPAIASHLSTAHTLALDKIWTVAIMTSDKRGHNRHDGDGARDDGNGICGAERRVKREGKTPTQFGPRFDHFDIIWNFRVYC